MIFILDLRHNSQKMKQAIIDVLLQISWILISTSIFLKFILWIQLNPQSRIGSLRSYTVWFTVRDIHDASSRKSARFRTWNNIISTIFWIGAIGLVILFVYNTDPIVDANPQKLKK